MFLYMKAPNLLSACFLILILFAPVLPAAEEILIQTDFSEADGDGALLPSQVDLPLKGPTAVRQGKSGSTITVGKEVLEGLEPPYALFNDVLPTDGANLEMVDPASITWNLIEYGLTSGVYELSWRFVGISPMVNSARMIIELGEEGGKVARFNEPIHPSALPAQVILSKGSFFPKTRTARYAPGVIYEIKITLDLDKKEWSSSLDGEVLLDPRPFPPAMLEASQTFQIRGVKFQNNGATQEQSYAIADVVMKKIAP